MRWAWGAGIYPARYPTILRPAPFVFNMKGPNMAKSQNYYSSETQIFWTCKALIDGRTISHKTEIREVNGWRLGAIIHRLKSDFHWPIVVEYRGPDNVAYYSLAKGADVTKLRFPPSARSLQTTGDAA